MKVLLDTHFLIWILTGSSRLDSYARLLESPPWGLSPVCLLELKFLHEVGRLELEGGFHDRLAEDARFVLDEVPLLALVRHSLDLAWTRDPFDRLLTAHSWARRIPFCTEDRNIRAHYSLIYQDRPV